MKQIFDDIIITNPDCKAYLNSYYTVKLSHAMKKGWFISAVFGSYGWCVKKAQKGFISRSVEMKFNCDRQTAENEINKIAEEKYLMYKHLLEGR